MSGSSGGSRRQMAARGVVENTPVAGHHRGIRHPRRGDDQPVGRVAMKRLGQRARLDCDLRQQRLD